MTQTTAVALPVLDRTWDALRPATGAGFRPREACQLAAALLEAPDAQRWRIDGEAARLTWQLDVSPGVVRLRQTRPKTPVRLKGRPPAPERRLFYRGGEKANELRISPPSESPTDVEFSDDDDEQGRVITGFSKASRLRMMRRLASLDWAPVVASEDAIFDATGTFCAGLPCMVTLTLPADWLRWAPTARMFKRQLAAFLRRWDRAVGEFQGCWKMETQRRGAPHLHLFARAPLTVESKVGRGRGARFVSEPFREWLSRTWWEVVGSGDPDHLAAGTNVDWGEGLRCSDPRRIAAYFAGYMADGSKEYQHRPPPGWEAEGTGRWWGVRRLETVAETVELDQQQIIEVRRLLRGWVKSQGRRPVRALASGRLFGATVLANDGPAVVAMLSRAVGPPGRGRPGGQVQQMLHLGRAA